MHTFLITIAVSLSILLFYVLLLWFLHKASVHFKKLDKNVGNIEPEQDLVANNSFDEQNINTYVIIKKEEAEYSEKKKN